MEPSIQITEDSRSIEQFFKPFKRDIMASKKQQKMMEKNKRERKNSTQLSLFGWLVKSRPKQNCGITRLQKGLIINIYSYLRISQIIAISQCCFYLYQCARPIWHDSQFFKELQTDKLSEDELRNIFKKGSRMGHIKQLKKIYMGKNLKTCREKIKLKVSDTSNNLHRQMSGNLLQVFQVSTKVNKSSAFLMDNHLQQIINSSFRSLVSIKLQSCRYIRKFYDVSKCTQLVSLSITQNSYFNNEDLRIITKNCSKIQFLDISGCDSLDQGAIKLISKLLNLRTLLMNSYQQPLGEVQCLKPLLNLAQISFQNSCIMDLQAIQLIKSLEGLRKIKLNGCQLLTDIFLQWLTSREKYQIMQLEINKTKFSEKVIEKWQKFSLKPEKQGEIVST